MLLRFSIVIFTSSILALARYLSPDPNGLGTHQQLGLPKCLFYAITHIPCPSCGLTTSFSHIMHGNFLDAFMVHPLGPLLFLLLIGFTIYLALGKSWDKISHHRFFDPGLYSFLMGLGLVWIYRLYTHYT